MIKHLKINTISEMPHFPSKQENRFNACDLQDGIGSNSHGYPQILWIRDCVDDGDAEVMEQFRKDTQVPWYRGDFMAVFLAEKGRPR